MGTRNNPTHTFYGVTNGTAGTNCSVEEHGTLYQRTTKITVTAADVPDIAGGADLSVGILVYTFPAGVIQVRNAYMSMAIQQVDGNITADTPDVGLGTTIAAGANALLSDTSGAENIMTGATADDCDGTAEVASVDTVLEIAAAGAHTVYFNIADGWAASGDANATATGTIIINWNWWAAT